MFAMHARYRGRDRRRANLVQRYAEALATLDGTGTVSVEGVEDVVATMDTPSALVDATLALLVTGDWAIGLGIVAPSAQLAIDSGAPASGAAAAEATALASKALGSKPRAGVVKVKAPALGPELEACFVLLRHVLHKRTAEGAEATSLMRSGLNQNEAAAQLGITKQAMSQRLQAAGWQAEVAGYRQAVGLAEYAANI